LWYFELFVANVKQKFTFNIKKGAKVDALNTGHSSSSVHSRLMISLIAQSL
jgi:hypothetical protein